VALVLAGRTGGRVPHVAEQARGRPVGGGRRGDPRRRRRADGPAPSTWRRCGAGNGHRPAASRSPANRRTAPGARTPHGTTATARADRSAVYSGPWRALPTGRRPSN
jgi:hypothetical protein